MSTNSEMETMADLEPRLNPTLNSAYPGLVNVMLSLEVTESFPVTLSCQGATFTNCKVESPDFQIDSKYVVEACVFFVPNRSGIRAHCDSKNVEKQKVKKEETSTMLSSQLVSIDPFVTNVDELKAEATGDGENDDGSSGSPNPPITPDTLGTHIELLPEKDPRNCVQNDRQVQLSPENKETTGYVKKRKKYKKREKLSQNSQVTKLREEKYKGWLEYQPLMGTWMCTRCKLTKPTISAIKSHIHYAHFRNKYGRPDEDAKSGANEEEASTSKVSTDAAVNITDAIRSLHKYRMVTCDICGHSIRATSFKECEDLLKGHKFSKHGIDSGERHQCKQCPKTFQTILKLRGHVSSVHGKYVKCPVDGCSTVLKEKCVRVHLKHMHSKQNESVFCHVCGLNFKNQSSLQSHISHTKGHGAERKRVCSWPGCGKAFFKTNHLRVHSRLHTNEMPYQCELCGFRARQNTSLSYHKKKHHPDMTS